MFIWSLFIIYRIYFFAYSCPVEEDRYEQEAVNKNEHHYL